MKFQVVSQKVMQAGTVIALFALIIIFGALRPEVFLNVNNLRNIFEQIAILTIVACAQTLVMVCGDFDLSLGANVSLSGVVVGVALLAGVPVPLAIILALLAGGIVGATNGWLISVLKLPAFIATLATMTAFGGFAYVVTAGTTVHDFPTDFEWIGQARIFEIPLPVFIAFFVLVATWIVLRFTAAGRRWYAIGGNSEVARLSGVKVRRGRFFAFMIAGFIASIAGIVLASRIGSASATSGSQFMLLSLAAVFLGMTVPASGQATVGGTLVGVAILGVLANGLNIVGVDTYWQEVLTGVIIAAGVALSTSRSKKH